MTSPQTTPVPYSSPVITPIQNGSPIKSVGSQSSSYDDTVPSQSSLPGTSTARYAADTVASSPKGKERQRLSQVVPKRPSNRKLTNEEEPWEPKNVLSFDGGGIRGLYSLFLLKQLMNHIKLVEETFSDGNGDVSYAPSSFHPIPEPLDVSHIPPASQDDEQGNQGPSGHYLPCHYFDYICGTSTGGLIAIMLSRFRMTVEDCISEYENMAGSVFGNARFFHQTFGPTVWLKRPKYDAGTLQSVIQEVTQRRGEIAAPDQDGSRFKTGSDMCRTFVFAYKREGHNNRNTGMSIDVPYIFRSYNHFPRGDDKFPFSLYPRNPGPSSGFPIWKVARATTAAPLYFAPMQEAIDNTPPPPRLTLISRISTISFNRRQTGSPATVPVTFIDGGFGEANNPSTEAYNEIITSNERIGTLVSIGTARGKGDKFETGLRRLIAATFAVVGDPEPSHLTMLKESKEKGFGYYRLNEPNGLPDLQFDEWKPRKNGSRTQQKILAAYQRWAADPKVLVQLQMCAMDLVRRRRLRTADESQWERYSIKAYFDCQETKCPKKGDKRWYSRNDFQNHLMVDHGMQEGEDLQKTILSHRKVWRYKPQGNGARN